MDLHKYAFIMRVEGNSKGKTVNRVVIWGICLTDTDIQVIYGSTTIVLGCIIIFYYATSIQTNIRVIFNFKIIYVMEDCGKNWNNWGRLPFTKKIRKSTLWKKYVCQFSGPLYIDFACLLDKSYLDSYG